LTASGTETGAFAVEVARDCAVWQCKRWRSRCIRRGELRSQVRLIMINLWAGNQGAAV